jgi:thiosulfate/3-mercaptopyruvate sulfurtransferase
LTREPTAVERFKPAPELAKIFQEAGIDLKRPAITYCQSGGRASVVAFALELMEADAVRDYYRRWAEWGNAEDTPIARPKGKCAHIS